ncbi:MAG: Homoserine O-acetyltransferase [Candidatus Ozemobacter sibiricus]|uniref:Probable acyltransferase n=1 Tax=Candidatus Ozemobacter sibiricus TaxID=2268124 RepID=A0A367ZLB9_9BACT|nr:MAG: Homoserine O-acetyltransferase [Candidatus Ozemobacter sibiricus]
MLVTKQTFSHPAFRFELTGRTIPIRLGYEAYGRLSPAKDNAILVCHYFTGTSHAAGRYTPDDAAPGWWDALIGPGKVIDTERWFVICVDTISNINFHNPNVVTTGPASLDPETGRPYAMTFPIFTLTDVVRAQRLLLDELGIRRLRCVIGPSMGGLQAFLWGRHFPDDVDKVVAVVATPMMRPSCVMVPNQLGIEAIMLDPDWRGGDYYGHQPPHRGLLLAFKILLTETRTDHWAETNFGRRFADPTFTTCPDPYRSFQGRFLVETEVEKTVLQRMQFFDANSYIYIAKANTLFDLRGPGEELPQALAHLKMPTLMIIDESDLMFTREQAEAALPHLPKGTLTTYNSRNGHLSCLFETELFANRLAAFLA